MAGFSDIQKELGVTPSQLDVIRRKYIKQLATYTKRNVIVYYSGWLSKPGIPGVDINDLDMAGFMENVKDIDCSKGLDLILHTPGGNPTAAESIVKYLRIKFNNDIRVIVPHLAMSAGTMIACSGKEIIMGKHSSLGPVDPQLNGLPAYSVKKEFEEAKNDLLKNPNNVPYWSLQLQKYPPGFLNVAIDSINLSSELVKEWLGTCMFDKDTDKEKIINIVNGLNEHDNSKTHGRHFDVQFCKKLGLKITLLEDDPKLQDKVLSIHHSMMLTFNSSNAVKIIENNEKGTMIQQAIIQK